MNGKQTIVMWIGIIVFVLMGLFPPWVATGRPSGGATLYFFPQYSFIMKPPAYPMGDELTIDPCIRRLIIANWKNKDSESKGMTMHHIDVTRLVIQWLIVAVITGGLIITQRDKNTRQDGSES